MEMYQVVSEYLDGGWQYSFPVEDQMQAIHLYAQITEFMFKDGFKRVQLRRDGQLMAETTR